MEAVNKYVIQAVVKACHQDVIHAVIKAVIQAVIEAVVSNDITCKKNCIFKKMCLTITHEWKVPSYICNFHNYISC